VHIFDRSGKGRFDGQGQDTASLWEQMLPLSNASVAHTGRGVCGVSTAKAEFGTHYFSASSCLG